MGVLVDLESRRRERRQSDLMPDLLLSAPIGECTGCGAFRSTVSITHDSGPPTGVDITLVTVPHWSCDREKVISQEPTLEDLEAKEAERDRTRDS